MKKVLHALSGVLIILTPVLLAGLLIYGHVFNTKFRDAMVENVAGSFWGSIATGVVLLLIVALYLLTFGRSGALKNYVSFESDSGSVSISTNAVRDFVRKIADEFGAVVSMDPKVHPGKNTVSIDLHVRIKAGSKLPELSQMLQGRVRESIRDGLGIPDVRTVRVKVQEIVGDLPTTVTEPVV